MYQGFEFLVHFEMIKKITSQKKELEFQKLHVLNKNNWW